MVKASASPQVAAILMATATPKPADLIEKAVVAGEPMLCEKLTDLSLSHMAKATSCAPSKRGLLS